MGNRYLTTIGGPDVSTMRAPASACLNRLLLGLTASRHHAAGERLLSLKPLQLEGSSVVLNKPHQIGSVCGDGAAR